MRRQLGRIGPHAQAVWRPLAHYLRDDSGPTAIEYAMIAGAVALVIVGAVFLLGAQVQALYQQILAAFG